MKILSLCGSLRAGSSNALLQAEAQRMCPENEWQSLNIGRLPYFDPALQYSDQTPGVVLEARDLAARADVIFVFTPEYAHGIPGVLKNAFEWIFHEGTQRKPVYVAIGSAEGEYARSQLIEILSTMDFEIDESRVLLLKGLRSSLGADGRFKNPADEQIFLEFCQKIQR
jgi:NAD(P)H-dependent FMN reductase